MHDNRLKDRSQSILRTAGFSKWGAIPADLAPVLERCTCPLAERHGQTALVRGPNAGQLIVGRGSSDFSPGESGRPRGLACMARWQLACCFSAIEQVFDNQDSRARALSLQILHSSRVATFINRPGFGLGRMGRLPEA
jgi:hypothetical protein